MTMEVNVLKDLTDRTPRQPKRVKIEPDVFDCALKLPAGVVQDIMDLRRLMGIVQRSQAAGNVDTDSVEEMNRKLFGMLDVILLPESAELFAKRMRDPVNPIDTDDISRFVAWVIEEYGERPTTPSSASSPLPTTTGMSSTDGPWPMPNTPDPSPWPISSTSSTGGC